MSFDANPTGRTRLKPVTIRVGLFRKKQVVIHQTEMRGFVPEWYGVMADGSIRTWWVDTPPEWLLESEPPAETQTST